MNDKLKIVPFEAEHIRYMDLIDRDRWLQTGDHLTRFAQLHETRGVGYTVGIPGMAPIACGGIDVWWEHVGEAWLLLAKPAANYVISIVRLTKDYLEEISNSLSLNRIQASIKATDKIAIRFIEALGFYREGLMKKYGPDGSDYYMYGRVR